MAGSNKEGMLEVDALFLGLTRPAMILGVSYSIAIINAFICLVYFIMTSDLKVIIVLPGLHGIGYMISMQEPLAIELIIAKLSKCNFCKNKSFHGNVNSYDVY